MGGSASREEVAPEHQAGGFSVRMTPELLQRAGDSSAASKTVVTTTTGELEEQLKRAFQNGAESVAGSMQQQQVCAAGAPLPRCRRRAPRCSPAPRLTIIPRWPCCPPGGGEGQGSRGEARRRQGRDGAEGGGDRRQGRGAPRARVPVREAPSTRPPRVPLPLKRGGFACRLSKRRTAARTPTRQTRSTQASPRSPTPHASAASTCIGGLAPG